MHKLLRAAVVSSLALFAVLAAPPARAIEVAASGRLTKDFTATAPAIDVARSTGTVCVHVRAGTSADPDPGGTIAPCVVPSPGGVAGRGRTAGKFTSDGGGTLEGDSDAFANLANTVATSATGSGGWSAYVFPDGAATTFGAAQDASARVTRNGATGATGHSVGNARDPLEFTMPTAGSVSYTVALSDLQLKSDTSRGRNVIYLRARIENVSRGGSAINGDLWTLTISTFGVVTSSAEVQVNLTFAPALGISATQEAAAETFIRQLFEPLGGGSIGFLGDVDFIGGGGLLAALVLEHGPATVRYDDDFRSESELLPVVSAVPGLSFAGALGLGLALASCALIVLLSAPRRRRRWALAPVLLVLGLPGRASAQVQGCAEAQYLDRTAASADRELGWDLSIGTSPERCLLIRAGQTVTWNGNLDTHPLDPQGGDAPSPIIPGSSSGLVRFDTPGTFGYVCGVHPSMRGAIRVVAAPAPAAVPASGSTGAKLGLLLAFVLGAAAVLARRRRDARA